MFREAHQTGVDPGFSGGGGSPTYMGDGRKNQFNIVEGKKLHDGGGQPPPSPRG